MSTNKKEKPYLGSDQLERFMALLNRWFVQLEREAEQGLSELKHEEMHHADLIDMAQTEENVNLQILSHQRDTRAIARIKRCLADIKMDLKDPSSSRRYGYCSRCKNPIGVKRLEARPIATLCIDCKTREEQI